MKRNCPCKTCDTQCLKEVEAAWMSGDLSIYPSSFVECVHIPEDGGCATYRCKATGAEWTDYRLFPHFVPEGCEQEHIAIGVVGHHLPEDAQRLAQLVIDAGLLKLPEGK